MSVRICVCVRARVCLLVCVPDDADDQQKQVQHLDRTRGLINEPLHVETLPAATQRDVNTKGQEVLIRGRDKEE